MGAAQSAEEKEEERQRRIAAEYQETLEAKQEYAAQIRALEAQVTEKVKVAFGLGVVCREPILNLSACA